MRKTTITLVLAGSLLSGCASVENPVSGKVERTVMTEQDEKSLGAEQHRQVLADYGVVNNAALQAYVNDIGQRLARNSQRPGLPWHFTVVDSPEVNAFALPGGYVYITRGLMAYMDSEADLAGVIGHEIGHVTARHGAQRATRQQAAGFGVLAATVLGAVLESQGLGGAADAASKVSQNVAAGYIASYSREQELQADRLGADYLAKASYNPQNMVDVIEVLKNQERFATDRARAQGASPGAGSGWLASHPTNEQRLEQMRAVVSQFQGRYGDDGRSRYLKAIEGLAFGESREGGVTRGDSFYHEALGFAITAPAGWKVQNASDTVALVGPRGDAALLLRLVPAQSGNDHDDILRRLLKAEQGRKEPRRINGMAATHFEGTLRGDQGPRQVELTLISGPAGRQYLLVYAARSAEALQRSQRAMREAEASFRPLGAAERAAARPWQLRSVSYPAGGFAQLARQSPLPASNAEQQLRLLNGVYAGGEPRLGQLVKVVE